MHVPICVSIWCVCTCVCRCTRLSVHVEARKVCQYPLPLSLRQGLSLGLSLKFSQLGWKLAILSLPPLEPGLQACVEHVAWLVTQVLESKLQSS